MSLLVDNKMSQPLRHRKILRDNIQGIVNPQIKRLSQVANVHSLSGLCYDEIRMLVRFNLNDIVGSAVTVTQHYRQKTVSTNAINVVMEVKHEAICIGWRSEGNLDTSKKMASYESDHPNKGGRTAPGAKAGLKIHYAQTKSACAVFGYVQSHLSGSCARLRR